MTADRRSRPRLVGRITNLRRRWRHELEGWTRRELDATDVPACRRAVGVWNAALWRELREAESDLYDHDVAAGTLTPRRSFEIDRDSWRRDDLCQHVADAEAALRDFDASPARWEDRDDGARQLLARIFGGGTGGQQ